MTHKRSMQLVAALAMLGLVAAGCGSSATPSAGTAAPTAPSGSEAPTPGTAGTPSTTGSAGNVGSSSPPASGAPATICGTAGASPCPTVPVALARNLPFTPPVDCGAGTQCQIQLDVTYPAPGTGGGPWPVIVAIPGGPEPLGGRAGLESLAYSLAAQGTVVYLADYRSMPNQDAGFPQTFQDVACAISFARATASTYGGAAGKVTLVGGSLGGWVGAVVAFTPQPFPLSQANCLQPSASARPDAFVGVAGIYSLDQIDPGYLTGFFGGTRQAQPGAWAAGDPYVIVTANRNETIPVRLVAGSKDTVGSAISQQTFSALLQASGYNVTLTMIPGANHAGVFESPVTPETIMGLVRGSP